MTPVTKLLTWKTAFVEEAQKLPVIHRISTGESRFGGINYLLG